jgi:RNA polymerase sigma-70 factor (ECF subfamily)
MTVGDPTAAARTLTSCAFNSLPAMLRSVDTSSASPDASHRPSVRRGARATLREVDTDRLSEDDLEALQNREPWAVKRWVYGNRKIVFRFLLKKVKDEDAARELQQETFFQALRSLPSFRGDAKVSTWLCSIARNLAYKHFRTEKRYTQAESETLEYIHHADENRRVAHGRSNRSPQAQAERSERKQMIHAAMEELSDSYREVIRLRDLEEKSTEEVAEELGLTRVNVRVRLHRARKQLREQLDPQVEADYRRAA